MEPSPHFISESFPLNIFFFQVAAAKSVKSVLVEAEERHRTKPPTVSVICVCVTMSPWLCRWSCRLYYQSICVSPTQVGWSRVPYKTAKCQAGLTWGGPAAKLWKLLVAFSVLQAPDWVPQFLAGCQATAALSSSLWVLATWHLKTWRPVPSEPAKNEVS